MLNLQKKAANALRALKSFKQDVKSEHKKNFSPYPFFSKKGKRPKFSGTPVSKRSKARTHQFVCLADCNGMKVPSTGFEREVLLDAGLGEKKITIPYMDCSAEEYRDQVLEAFPKLTEAGGYEIMCCIPNSRVLEPIAASALPVSPSNSRKSWAFKGVSETYPERP